MHWNKNGENRSVYPVVCVCVWWETDTETVKENYIAEVGI